jgi:hypothetical protein
MTTDRELMQQALDALEQMAKEGWLLHGPEGMDEAQTKCIQSLEALRARLAQPEQEPVAQVDYNERGNICWLFGKQVPDKTLLYTAPPQSEWQNAALRLGEELSTVGPDGYYNMSASEWLDWAMKHITPARIEQEPVAWVTTWNEHGDAGVELHWAKHDKGLSSKHTPLFYKSATNTNLNPIGWLYQTNNTWEQFSFIEPPDDAYDEGSLVPVYTAPPQREWQGLTDEELSLLWVNYHGDNCLADGRILSYEQAIQAKLKEKHEKF